MRYTNEDVETIRSYSIDNWNTVFERVFNCKPLDLEIDFVGKDFKNKIFDLYFLLNKENISKENFVESLMHIFENALIFNQNEFLYEIIQVFSLLKNDSLAHFAYQKFIKNKLKGENYEKVNLHYELLNSIIENPILKVKIKEYFNGSEVFKQVGNHYQVAISFFREHYPNSIYQYLNTVLNYLDEKNIDFFVMGLGQWIFEEKSSAAVSNWALSIPERNSNSIFLLKKTLFELLERYSELNELDKQNYSKLRAWANSYNVGLSVRVEKYPFRENWIEKKELYISEAA